MAGEKEIRTILTLETRLKGGGLFGGMFDNLFGGKKGAKSPLQELKNLKEINNLAKTLEKSAKSSDMLAKSLEQAVKHLRALGAAAKELDKIVVLNIAPGGGRGGGGGEGGDGGGGGGRGTPGGGRGRRIGGFTQGFLQGIGGPAFLQRKGGFGQYMGHSLGQVGAGAASALFTGSEGVEKMLSGLPAGFGGIAGGQFRELRQAADEAFGVKRQIAGMSNLMTPGRLGFRAAEMGATRATNRSQAGMMFDETGQMIDPATGRPFSTATETDRGNAESRFINSAGSMGQRMGIAIPEALDIAKRAIGVSGQSLFSEESFRTQQSAIAGARLGIAPETVGQFAFDAEAVGGNAERTMITAMAEAVELGLRGAEVPKTLQMIGAQIEQSRLTGAPVDPFAMVRGARGFADMGIEPEAARAMAGGLQSTGQRIGMQGPQGLDWEFLRDFGGLNGEASPEAVLAAMQRAESGQGITAKSVTQSINRTIQSGGGGAAGQLLAQAKLNRFGARTSAASAGFLGLQLPAGDEFSGGNAEFLRQSQGLAGLAEPMVDQTIQQDVANTNRRIVEAGMPMIDIFKRLAEVQTTVTAAAAKTAPALDVLTGAIQMASKVMLDSAAGLAMGTQVAAGYYGNLLPK